MATPPSKLPARILRQTWTIRDDLQANRDVVFVYGDNVAREGHRGLARQMRGAANAHPISISWGPFDPFTYLTADAAMVQILEDLEALYKRAPSLIVWPLSGIVPEFQTVPDEVLLFLREETRKRFNLADPI